MSEKRIEAVRTGSSTDPCCCTECYPCIGEYGCSYEDAEWDIADILVEMSFVGTFIVEGDNGCPGTSTAYSPNFSKTFTRLPLGDTLEGDTYQAIQCVGRPCAISVGVGPFNVAVEDALVIPDALDEWGDVCRPGSSSDAIFRLGFWIQWSCSDNQYAIGLGSNANGEIGSRVSVGIPWEERNVLLGTKLEEIKGQTITWTHDGLTISITL